MRSLDSSFAGRIAALCVAHLLATTAFGQTIVLDVDATDLRRNLLRSTMRIEASPGPMDLYYCIWTPGNHTPSGPIENVIDLVIRDCRGNTLAWDRDPAQIERLSLTVPDDCREIRVEMGYIASQPNANSRSTDSYGRPDLGVLNWNTVLLYPGGKTNQQITVAASLGLPSAWSFGTPLPVRREEHGRFETMRSLTPGVESRWIEFEPVPLAQLIDTPVIMGRHVRPHALETGVEGAPDHVIVTVAAEERYGVIPEWLTRKYAEMCRQTMLVFQKPGKPPFPRERFEFLLTVDDTLGYGVEHATSTLIGVKLKTFSEAKSDEVRGGGASTTVLPHEYFHVWCGKLVAPEGLVSENFHTPARPELLWVYEGLTTHYDNVLAVRSGLLSFEEFTHEILAAAVTLEQRSGRLWRSVEDTARAARVLRQRGLYWYDHRRGQDYYGEGAKFWLEADAIIRAGSAGERSLDDFCREFFDRPARPVGDQATFDRGDVVRALGELDPSTDWDALIRERLEQPVSELGMDRLLARLGWRLEYAGEPSEAQKKMKAFDEENADEPNLRTSLGLRVNKSAEIIDIVPGSPADEAGLAYGMKILAVEGWLYSPSRLRDAVKDSPAVGKVTLVTSFGERVESFKIAYDRGPRVPRLVRIEGTRDLLTEIAAPR